MSQTCVPLCHCHRKQNECQKTTFSSINGQLLKCVCFSWSVTLFSRRTITRTLQKPRKLATSRSALCKTARELFILYPWGQCNVKKMKKTLSCTNKKDQYNIRSIENAIDFVLRVCQNEKNIAYREISFSQQHPEFSLFFLRLLGLELRPAQKPQCLYHPERSFSSFN